MSVLGIQAERDSLAERYAMLQRSLAQSEEDEEKLDALGGQLRSQVCVDLGYTLA